MPSYPSCLTVILVLLLFILLLDYTPPPPTVFIYIFMFTHKHICLTTSCETIISHQDAKLSQHIQMLTPVKEAERMTSINQGLIFEIGVGNAEG